VVEGQVVSTHYDPLLAKLIASGPDRASAQRQLRAGLAATRVAGLDTNASFLDRVLADPAFAAGAVTTGFLEERADALFAPTAPDAAVWAAAFAPDAPPDPAADPWETLAGLRLNQPSTRHRWMLVDGEACRLSAVGSGDQTTFVLQPDASAAARRQGRPAPDRIEMPQPEPGSQQETVDWAPHRHGRRVWRGAATWDIEFADPLAGPAGVESDHGAGSLLAPMPGTVTAHAVQLGALVETGETLLVIEAMKSEHAIKAPTAGRVRSFLFQPGEQVGEGDRLVDFEPTQSSADGTEGDTEEEPHGGTGSDR
jgi:acetyl/propionyl-CoA carboxylase alpha subunit